MSLPSKNNNISTAAGRLKLPKIRNLVFQGGSVKGTAYGGAVGGLEAAMANLGLDLDTQIHNVAGTSAGAITALAISLGTSTTELVQTIGNTDFKSFLDTKAYDIVSSIASEHSSAPSQASAAFATLPLLTTTMGLASGQHVLDYLESFVLEKTKIPHLTFGELHNLVLEDREALKNSKNRKNIRKDLFVIAYNLSLDEPQVFSYLETPNSIISDAVRCSMSIPFVFVPHKNYIKKHLSLSTPSDLSKVDLNDLLKDWVRIEQSEDLWIDGGITDNYPIWVFDKLLQSPHDHTLGFYLVSKEEKAEIEEWESPEGKDLNLEGPRREIKNILDYAKAVIETVISSQQTSAHKQGKDIDRTVYIDHLGTSMMNFGLTVEEKNSLVASGWDCVCQRCGLDAKVGKCQLLLKTKEMIKKEEKEKERAEKGLDLEGDENGHEGKHKKCIIV